MAPTPPLPSRAPTHAVVVGAGMGGLTAARALADYFQRVVILESDRLPADPLDRAGTPRRRHVHALIAGLRARGSRLSSATVFSGVTTR